MKYCEKCGSELLDDAQVCMNCGCAFNQEQTDFIATQSNKKSKKNTAILIIVTCVVAAVLAVGGLFLVNHVRETKVIEQLSGERFRFFEDHVYYALGKYDYEEKVITFDNNGELTYSYYFSNINAGDEYERDYNIKFKKKMAILEISDEEYEIQYDNYGEIEGLYDIQAKELYERK